jgi:flagellar motility protein MotE (MotC chaperone)
MKTLWQVVALLAIVHVLGALGVAGWLLGTDRVNRERLSKVKQVFAAPVAQEQAVRRQAADAASVAEAQEARQRALQGAGAGPESATQKLAAERQKNEIALRQLERTKSDLEALRLQITQLQAKVDQDRKQLAEDTSAFDRRVADAQRQADDKGFKKAVSLYESLPPRQTKDMFAQLMSQDKLDQVIDYLESMQPRKAAGVLKEFKTGTEVVQAVQLTQRLRERGSALAKSMEATR